MKKIFARTLVLVLMLGIFVPAQLSFASEINVTIDGVPVVFEGQGPTIIDGRTLVPIRGVFEHLGFDVQWYGGTQQIILFRGTTNVIIFVGNDRFSRNGEFFELDVPALIIDGRTLLPIRAVLESVGYDVDWNQATMTVAVTTIGSTTPSPTPTPTPTPSPSPTPSPTPAPTPSPTPSPTPAPMSQSEFEMRVFELTNAERASHGLRALTWHEDLAAAARAHSQDLVQSGTFGHNSSDGTDFATRITQTGARWWMVAENVSGGRSTPEAMVEGWMNSPGHRANILNPDLTHLGVGVYPSSGRAFTGTQKFIAAP